MGKSEWKPKLEPWPDILEWPPLKTTTWDTLHLEWKIDLEPWPELDNVEWPEVNTDVWEIDYPEWISEGWNNVPHSQPDEAPPPEPV